MANKKQESQEESVVVGESDTATIKKAIAEAQLLIEQGKTKVEASLVIYRALESYPQETVVSAMIEGASLTSKGALTYWYNCRRKIIRENASATHK